MSSHDRVSSEVMLSRKTGHKVITIILAKKNDEQL